MADLLFLAITIAFFLLCVGFVKLCDRIIGPDPRLGADTADAGRAEELEVAGR